MVSLGGHGKAKYTTGTRLGTSHGQGWEGVLAERWSHTEGDLGEVEVRDTEVIVMLDGRLPVRRRGDGQMQHCNAVPGMIWLCPNGVREDMIHLYGDVQESMHLFLPALPLSETLVREIDIDPETIQLKYQGGFRDPLIEQIAWAIRAEMTDPGPAGKIQTETLSMALGIHIVRNYSNLSPGSKSLPPVRGALDPRRIRRVTDFIDAHLSGDLTIAALAKEAYLSPFHFASAYKEATGTTPHRYVTDRRIERSRALIAEGELPLAEIAVTCGFSSQAHFCRWFKRLVGATPGEYFSICHSVSAASPYQDGLEGHTVDVDLTIERHDDILSVVVNGRDIDIITADFEKAVLSATRETDRAVILDFGATTSIGNRGLQAILHIARELQNRGARMVICSLSARDRDRFRATGLERFLPYHESRAQVLAARDALILARPKTRTPA